MHISDHCGQLPARTWRNTYLSDAILDLVAHSSRRIDLKGGTLRDKKKEEE
jgi:hypothetical protein